MNTRREILTGLSAAVISIIILTGSLLAANTEMRATIAQESAPTPTMTRVPTQIIVATPLPGQPTYTPLPTLTPSQTSTQALAVCSSPAGWLPITVQAGDSLDSLALTYNTTVKALQQANCLDGNTLYPGTRLYVPNTRPPTPVPCGPPSGWVYYTVQPGDNLYQISRIYGVSVAALQAANCMGSSTTIRVGQRLYVPNVPPNYSPTPQATNTPRPSATATVIPPSATATYLPSSPTATAALPSLTPTAPTHTPTNTPVTISATPNWTPTATNTLPPPTTTATFTPEPPTATPTVWPTSTTPPTSTPIPPTNTPVPPTNTPALPTATP